MTMTKDGATARRRRLGAGILALLACIPSAQCTSETEDGDPGAPPPDSPSRPAQQPATQQTRYEFSIHPDLPPYVFELDTTRSRIRVSTADGTTVQAMNLGPELVGLGGGRIEALDYDFDGYADIRYPWNAGSGGTWYATRIVVGVAFPDMMAVASLYFAFRPNGWRLAIIDVRDSCVR